MGSANLTLTRIQDLLDGPGILGAGQDGQALVWDFASGTFTTVEMSVDLSGLLPLTGGTMTGPLVLAGNPTESLHPATKQYVDGLVVTDHGALTGLGDDDHAQYLLVDGSRAMTGALKVVESNTNSPLSLQGATISSSGMTMATNGDLRFFAGGSRNFTVAGSGTTLVNPITIQNNNQHSSSVIRALGSGGQSGPLLELEHSSVDVFTVGKDGETVVTSKNAAAVPFTINLASGHTANAWDVKNSGGTVLAKLDASGVCTAAAFSTLNTITAGSNINVGSTNGYGMTYSGGLAAVALQKANVVGLAVGQSGGSPLVGFYGTAPAAKPTVTGSRGGNAALASLLTQLASLGLVVDSTA